AAGAAFALIGSATPSSEAPETERGLTLTWSAGPATLPRDDAAYAPLVAPLTGRGLLPFAPTRLSARRLSNGDLRLAWIRRARIGGDDFDAREVRLGEETEAYEAEIWFGGVRVRAFEVASPAALYTSAQQAVDLGGPAVEIELRVRQISAVAGPGLTAAASFAV
ncbi:hypothetical protein ACFQ4O_17620, partial [Methylopila musalis]